MAKFPWIGQTPELISGKHFRAIGKARLLFDFYTQRQTSPDGRVNYGKPVTYAWIRKQIPDCPPERTLRRHHAMLRAGGYIESSRATRGHLNLGMRVRILNQSKFAAPRQMGFFTEPVPMPVGKPVQKNDEVRLDQRPFLAAISGQKWPLKSLYDKGTDTNKTPAASPPSNPPLWKTAKANELLREIERYREIYAGSYEREDLERLRDRLDPLFEQLRRLGYVLAAAARGPASAVG